LSFRSRKKSRVREKDMRKGREGERSKSRENCKSYKKRNLPLINEMIINLEV